MSIESRTAHINRPGGRSTPGAREICSDASVVFFGTWSLINQGSYFCGFTFVQTWWAAWLGAMLGALMFWKREASIHPASSGRTPRVDWLLVAAVGVAVVLTLCLKRPDSDDEGYLGLSLLALDNRSSPMSSLSLVVHGYAMTSYDSLRASLSPALGIPLLASYYLVWPAALAGLIVIFQWRLFHLVNVRNKHLAL